MNHVSLKEHVTTYTICAVNGNKTEISQIDTLNILEHAGNSSEEKCCSEILEFILHKITSLFIRWKENVILVSYFYSKLSL